MLDKDRGLPSNKILGSPGSKNASLYGQDEIESGRASPPVGPGK